ncbi:uncharacterized protein TRIADDRAFT_32935 [Trichoplax adhaerens]|uniref:Hsp90 chaperone protein kinase-targeting subunit n=1 Tax=Trichoplax adhaerens TaxID=10228 RepID=B3SC16_TRIAD|nr:hypothetical protein TRIADDRAFT_32935 [Trichoplax adhaerens]EDV19727.1 hypothetical protein TRIADDRAFT_32935 [Trichoplax adhaerens]|eukprot:XP_002117751.1 hypothetical protein TRIADDRAFT_32935 [Trichoplax adhaerens]
MVDYSKWDNIEISDDEDDTHPNIDTASLFRWRHQARLQRMEEAKSEKDEYRQQREKLLEQTKEKDTTELNHYKTRLSELLEEINQLEEKRKELERKEIKTPWNVDTLSREGFKKTIINKPNQEQEGSTEQLSDEDKSKLWVNFISKHQVKLEKFADMEANWDSTKGYLTENPVLLCEEAANFLALLCIDLELEEDKEKLHKVAFHTVTMHFILELAKQLKTNPRATVEAFFKRIQKADKQYLDAFFDELRSFKDRVKDRAQARIKKAEEEERQKRLGPGGLDPAEIFESMPTELQECFESKDIPKLQAVLSAMPKEEAEDWLNKAIASGLWIPNADEGRDDIGNHGTPNTSDQ